MADNVVADPGAGGATFRTDDDGTAHWPYTKLAWGADDTQTIVTSGAGAIPIQDGGNSITVDGTVSAAQSGTWTVTGAGGTFPVTDSGGSLTVDGTVAATQSGAWNIGDVTGTVSLPTGAATSANQTTEIGLLTTIDADTGGILTSVQLLDDVVKTDDAAFTAATDKVSVVGGIVTSDSVDSGDAGAFAMLANRQQKVTLYDSAGVELSVGGGTQYTEDAAAAANPVGNALIVVREDARAGSLTTTDGDNVALRGNNFGELYVKHTDTIAATQSGTWNITNVSGTISLPTGAATAANQATPYTEDAAAAANPVGNALIMVRDDGLVGGITTTDGDNIALRGTNSGEACVFDNQANAYLGAIDNNLSRIVSSDDSSFTPGTHWVVPAGFFADETATDSVDEGDIGAARITLDRKQIVTPYPHTAGGLAIFRSLDLDESEEDVKTSAGQVYAMWVTNLATSTRFIKFYNATAANVTVGSTTPVITIGIPGNSTDDIAGNFGPGGMGIAFDTAICVAATTGIADADTGAPGANEVLVNIFYK